MAHAKRSPSKWPRYVRCPGAPEQEAPYAKERTDSAASIHGTQCHTLAEKFGSAGVDVLPDGPITVWERDGEVRISALGDDKPKDVTAWSGWDVDDTHREVVNAFLSYRAQREVELGAISVAHAEVRVDCGPIIGRTDVAGTADLVIFNNDEIEIVDLKGGVGFVPADTEQMVAYAAGALNELRNKNGELPTFKTVRRTIVQPRCPTPDDQQPGVRWVETTTEELLAELEEYGRVLAEGDQPNARLVPGEKQCQWCEARRACTARAAWIAEQSEAEIAQILVKEPEFVMPAVEEFVAEKSFRAHSGEKLDALLEAHDVLLQYLKDIQEEALYRIKHDIDPPKKYKVVQGRAKRAWALPETELVKRFRNMGLKKADYYKTTLISPAQAEKIPAIKDSEVRLRNIKNIVDVGYESPRVVPIDAKGEPLYGRVELPEDLLEDAETPADAVTADTPTTEPELPQAPEVPELKPAAPAAETQPEVDFDFGSLI